MTHHLESAGAENPACVQPALGSLFFLPMLPRQRLPPHKHTLRKRGRFWEVFWYHLKSFKKHQEGRSGIGPRPGCTWHSACSLSPCLSSACVFSPFACWAPCSPHPSSWVLCMACPPTQCPCGCICPPWAVPQGPPLYLPKLFYVSF